MLVAGMDASGNSSLGSRRFMGVVIGTQEGIHLIVKQLGHHQSHMRMITDKDKQNEIISKLQFDRDKVIAFCVQLDKDDIVAKTQEAKKTRHRYSRKRIYRTYDHLLYTHIQEKIKAFAVKHHHDIDEILFQCDQDCLDFVKSNGLKFDRPGSTHMLADIVAWSNNRGKEPIGVESVDLRALLKVELGRRFG